MTERVLQEATSAVIAVLAVIGAFLIVFYQLVHGVSPSVPDFVSLLIGAVVGSYLTRVASVNGARQAGTVSAQTVMDKIATTTGGNANAGSTPSVP